MAYEEKHHFVPKNVNPHRYVKCLGNIFVSLLPENCDFDDFELRRYPTEVHFKRIKDRRLNTTAEMKKKMNSLYRRGTRILNRKFNSGSTSTSIRFDFTPEFARPMMNMIEVSCRIISLTEMNGFSFNYNLQRMGSIQFKGELQTVINDLLERCKTELNEVHFENVVGMYPSAAYIPEHKVGCPWECMKIHEHTKKTNHQFFTEYSSNKPICFHKRQLLGQGLIPYVALDDKADEEKENEDPIIDNNEEDETFIFDNMFEDNEGNLAGIRKKKIRYDELNFLNIVDRDAVTALMSCSLSHVGINAKTITLYLKCSNNQAIYCTNATSSSEIPNASKFVMDYCYENPKIQNYLVEKHNIPRKAFEDYDDDDSDNDNNDDDDDDDNDNDEDDDFEKKTIIRKRERKDSQKKTFKKQKKIEKKKEKEEEEEEEIELEREADDDNDDYLHHQAQIINDL